MVEAVNNEDFISASPTSVSHNFSYSHNADSIMDNDSIIYSSSDNVGDNDDNVDVEADCDSYSSISRVDYSLN